MTLHPEIESWLKDLSREDRTEALLDHEVPEDSPEYDQGYQDATTVLAHRILSVSARIKQETA